ncbi:hypothetical protein ABUW04_03685 [Streptacidiphilus sp. N1-10]|uniref:Uncharacterized protein n=1 Tax=Streptacidiphilus jeojiensis TaxID=3229225 RepID=A0ABV6XGG0_9ACTN
MELSLVGRAVRRFRRAARPLLALVSVIVCGAVLCAALAARGGGATTPSVNPATAAGATAADALIDLMQPAGPLPVFVDPGSGTDTTELVDAVQISQFASPAARPSSTVLASLAGVLDSLPRKGASGQPLLDVLGIVHLDQSGHYGLLPAARQSALGRYLTGADLSGSSLNLLLNTLEGTARDLRQSRSVPANAAVTRALAAFLDTSLTTSCAVLRTGETSTDPALLGLLVDIAAADPAQHCYPAADVRARYDRQLRGTRIADAPDLAVMAELVQQGVDPTLAPGTSFSGAANGYFSSLEQELATTPSLTCPVSALYQAVGVDAAAGHAAAPVPAALTDCTQRALRWDGSLPESVAPSPVSAGFGIAALRSAPLSATDRQLVDQELALVDLGGLAGDPRTELVAALADAPDRITPALVRAFESRLTPSSAQDLTLLAAASDVLGGCDAKSRTVLGSWLAGLGQAKSQQTSDPLWSMFAVHDAKACFPAGDPVLARAQRWSDRAVAQVLAHPASAGSGSDTALLSWLRSEQHCLSDDSPATPPVTAAATAAPAAPAAAQSWATLVGSHPPTVLDLYARIRTAQTAAQGCVPSWLSPTADR